MNNKISIVTITYNNLTKTKKSLMSILDLLDRNDVLELIIWDNNSNIDTQEFLKKYSEQNSKIFVNFSDTNLGCAGARKKLFKLAKGNKILSLDSDVVVSDAGFIDKLKDKEQGDKIGLVGCAGAFIDHGNVEFKLVPEDFEGEVDSVIGYCQFFSKNLIDRGLSYDEYYYPNGEDDLDFSLQIIKNHNLECYKISQNNFGLQHDYSHTNRNNLDRRNKNFKHIFKKFQIYDQSLYGRIKFTIKSSVLIKKLKRCLGKLNPTNNS